MEKLSVLLNDVFVPMIIAVFGGVVRLANSANDKRKFTVKMFLSGVMTASFTGILVYWLTDDLDINENIRSATVALAGYTSRDLIGILSDQFLKRFGKRKEDSSNDK